MLNSLFNISNFNISNYKIFANIFDNIVMVYKTNLDMMGIWISSALISMIFLGFYPIVSFIGERKRGKNTNRDSDSRKKRENTLREIQTLTLQHHASLEGITLLAGALTKKVNDFEKLLTDINQKIDQKISDSIISNVEPIETTVEDLHHDVDQIKTEISDKFSKIQRNFILLGNKLGEFTDDEYRKFVANINEQVREMKGAIFLPDEDNDSDNSEYQP